MHIRAQSYETQNPSKASSIDNYGVQTTNNGRPNQIADSICNVLRFSHDCYVVQ